MIDAEEAFNKERPENNRQEQGHEEKERPPERFPREILFYELARQTKRSAAGGAENSRYALYLPKMTPGRLAEAAYRRFKNGNWVIIEGWLNRMFVGLARFVPGYFLIPSSGWFFQVRDDAGKPLEPKPLEHPDARTGHSDEGKV